MDRNSRVIFHGLFFQKPGKYVSTGFKGFLGYSIELHPARLAFIQQLINLLHRLAPFSFDGPLILVGRIR